jgi:glutamate-1-semialdehyde 2,1-aminomutase
LFWGVPEPIESYAEAIRDDRVAVAELTGRLLDRGFHIPERGLILLSAAHTPDQISDTVAAFVAVLGEMTSTKGSDGDAR